MGSNDNCGWHCRCERPFLRGCLCPSHTFLSQVTVTVRPYLAIWTGTNGIADSGFSRGLWHPLLINVGYPDDVMNFAMYPCHPGSAVLLENFYECSVTLSVTRGSSDHHMESTECICLKLASCPPYPPDSFLLQPLSLSY